MKRLSEQTLYEILEIPQDASPLAIEAAVERARTLYGPGSLATYTLMSPEEAALLGARIDEAKRVLLDPDARVRYDASLATMPEEVRAAANGTNGAATPQFPQVPVIPAVQPPPPEPPAVLPPDPEPVAPARSAREEAALPPPPPASAQPPAAPPPADPPPAAPLTAAPPPPVPLTAAPARLPIRLDREIPAPPAAAAQIASATPPPVAPAPAPEPEVPMPEGAAWTGEALRRVREARGITIPQIAERTKVTRYHVENIEAERFSALPAPVYLRGILLSLARELRLDGQKVARAYLDRAAAALAGKR